MSRFLTVAAIPALWMFWIQPEVSRANEAVENSGMQQKLDSGRDVGQYVPTFYSRAVTGPLRNRSVCFVCRNGGRPVVMILMRDLQPEFSKLLQKIDRVVDENRAAGLRSFGVLLGEVPSDDIGPVQTFSFDNKIAMPLAVASEAIATPAGQDVHEEAALTVVLYRRRRVESKFAFRAGELAADDINSIIDRIHDFLVDGQ